MQNCDELCSTWWYVGDNEDILDITASRIRKIIWCTNSNDKAKLMKGKYPFVVELELAVELENALVSNNTLSIRSDERNKWSC